MNLVWDRKTLGRLRSALAKAAPRAARQAALLRSQRSVKLRLQQLLLPAIGLAVASIWLTGGLASKQSDAIAAAAAGFAGVLWWLGAMVLSGVLLNASPASVQVPEILMIAPAPEPWHAERARHRVRRWMLLLLLAPLAVAAITVAAWHARQRGSGLPYDHGLAVWSALLLCIHALLLAAALPLIARWLTKIVLRLFPAKRLPRYAMPGVILILTVGVIGVLLGPLAIEKHKWVRDIGRALSFVAPPSGILLWPARPESPPVWQLAFTAALVWPAWSGIRQWLVLWNRLPRVDLDMQYRWESDHYDEEDYDEEYEEIIAGTATDDVETTPAPPPPPDPAQLRTDLRTHLQSDQWKSDRFLVPSVPPLTRRSLLPLRGLLISSLAGLTFGAVWGLPMPLAAGWLWLLGHTISIPSLPWMHALERYRHHQIHDRIALHEWLPISVRPVWRAAEKHRDQACVSAFCIGAVLCAAGWIITALAGLLPPIVPILLPDLPLADKPWPGYLPSWMYPASALIILAGSALVMRAAAPAVFGT